MKMGTIVSPCPYDAAARHALQSASLRRSAILRYASMGGYLPHFAGWSGYPSITALTIDPEIDAMEARSRPGLGRSPRAWTIGAAASKLAHRAGVSSGRDRLAHEAAGDWPARPAPCRRFAARCRRATGTAGVVHRTLRAAARQGVGLALWRTQAHVRHRHPVAAAVLRRRGIAGCR